MKKEPEELGIYTEGDGQISFVEEDNYFPIASDYGKVSKYFIERYTYISYLANLGMMLALQNISVKSKGAIAGTIEEERYAELYKKTKTDYSDGYISCVKIADFIRIFDLNRGGKTYNSIAELYNGEALRNQWQILYEDEHIIAGTMVLTGTYYDQDRHELYMKFNPDLAPYIKDIQNNYAMISLPVLGKLKESYIVALYQIMKGRYDLGVAQNKKYGYSQPNEIILDYELEELQFLMGMYPLNLTSNEPDMKQAVELVKTKQYKTAATIMKEKGLLEKYIDDEMQIRALNETKYFTTYYLLKAFYKINGFYKPEKLELEQPAPLKKYEAECRTKHPTDIHFRYIYLKSGRGGKIEGIRLYISKAYWGETDTASKSTKKKEITVDIVELNKQQEIVTELTEQFGGAVKESEALMLGKLAGWDIERIKKACKVAKEGTRPNLVGFLHEAIKNNYEPAVMYQMEEPEEKYPLVEIKKKLQYDDVILMNPEYATILDSFIDIIYEYLNNEAQRIRIGGELLSADIVRQKMLELNAMDLVSAIEKYLNGKKSEVVTPGYILTILYRIKAQTELEIGKQVYRDLNCLDPKPEYD